MLAVKSEAVAIDFESKLKLGYFFFSGLLCCEDTLSCSCLYYCAS